MVRVILILLLIVGTAAQGKDYASLADSIRKAYKIPEMNYAVISANSVYEMHASGVTKINTNRRAKLSDLFRIGSNTKEVTGFVAALLVKQHKIAWDTKFFDLFPELKAGSCKEYHDLTLLDLLSLRAKLFPYTYTYATPVKGQFAGSDSEQRYQFAAWFLRHEPVPAAGEVHFSNLSYVAAALMLERASGKSLQQLVSDLGRQISIDFRWGQPNMQDTLQTWGHDAALKPEPPQDNYKLAWLMAAGNISMTLPDYVNFIQLQLRGLRQKSELLSKKEFEFLHFGRERFSVGWFSGRDNKGRRCSWHMGNPGTFLTKVYIFDKEDKAFIIFCNAQTDKADEGTGLLYEALKKKYLP